MMSDTFFNAAEIEYALALIEYMYEEKVISKDIYDCIKSLGSNSSAIEKFISTVAKEDVSC